MQALWCVFGALHSIHLDCDLVKGCVVVWVSPEFPMDCVALILGNDLAFDDLMTLNPEVITIPQQSADLQQKYPGVFSVCCDMCNGQEKKTGFASWGQ